MISAIIVLALFLFVSIGLNYFFIRWIEELKKEEKEKEKDKNA